MSTPDNTSSLVQGNWFEGLQSWVYLPLNTSLAPDVKDTFYAQSVLTPQDDLLTNDSIKSFVTYLAEDGYDTETVCAYLVIHNIITDAMIIGLVR